MVCSLHFYSSFKKTLVESPFIFFINRSSKDDPKLQITKSHWVLFSCIYLWIQMYLMTSEFISVKIIKPWWVETRKWSCCPFFSFQCSSQSPLLQKVVLPQINADVILSQNFFRREEIVKYQVSDLSFLHAERSIMSLEVIRAICYWDFSRNCTSNNLPLIHQ